MNLVIRKKERIVKLIKWKSYNKYYDRVFENELPITATKAEMYLERCKLLAIDGVATMHDITEWSEHPSQKRKRKKVIDDNPE